MRRTKRYKADAAWTEHSNVPPDILAEAIKQQKAREAGMIGKLRMSDEGRATDKPINLGTNPKGIHG
jgi:hypothetical protein